MTNAFNKTSANWQQQQNSWLMPPDAAKFTSRAIASTVMAWHVLWLCSWQADAKSKWRLASEPFMGGKLFREAMEPILVETKERRKILPSLLRQADRPVHNSRHLMFIVPPFGQERLDWATSKGGSHRELINIQIKPDIEIETNSKSRPRNHFVTLEAIPSDTTSDPR